MKLLHRPCPLCGADNINRKKSRYSKDEWLIKECPGCSFAYLENPPPYSELEENFAWEKSHAKETDFRRKRSPLLYWISTKNIEFKGKCLKRNRLRDLLKSLSVSAKSLIEKFSFQDRLPTSDNMWLVAYKPEGR